jgi:hypothetical protein
VLADATGLAWPHQPCVMNSEESTGADRRSSCPEVFVAAAAAAAAAAEL